LIAFDSRQAPPGRYSERAAEASVHDENMLCILFSQDLDPLAERSTAPSRLPPGVAGLTLPGNAEVMEQVRRGWCSVTAPVVCAQHVSG